MNYQKPEYTDKMARQDHLQAMGREDPAEMNSCQWDIIIDYLRQAEPTADRSRLTFNVLMQDGESVVQIHVTGNQRNLITIDNCLDLIDYLADIAQSPAPITQGQFLAYLQKHFLHVVLYTATTVDPAMVYSEADDSTVDMEQADDSYYALEDDDRKQYVAGTDAEIKRYVAKQIEQEREEAKA